MRIILSRVVFRVLTEMRKNIITKNKNNDRMTKKTSCHRHLRRSRSSHRLILKNKYMYMIKLYNIIISSKNNINGVANDLGYYIVTRTGAPLPR